MNRACERRPRRIAGLRGGVRRRMATLSALSAMALAVTAAQAHATAITEYSSGLNPSSSPRVIVAGADGNLWFTDLANPGAIGRITPAGTITEYTAGLNAGSVPGGIVAGTDGNLWFTDDGSTRAIGRITPAGTITEYTTGLNPGSSLTGRSRKYDHVLDIRS